MRIKQSSWSSLLRSEIKKVIPSHLRLRAPAYVLAAAILMLLLAARSTAFAGSATWNLNPASGDWHTAANWIPSTVPNGPADTATFDVSNTTAVSISASTEVSGIVFNPGASSYTVTTSSYQALSISGVGITNNSGITQNFAADVLDGYGFIVFTNNATAGSRTAFTNYGATSEGAGTAGITFFQNNSSADNSTFTNNGAAAGEYAAGGGTIFFGSSTAGNASFTNNGATVFGGDGGFTEFHETSTADNGTFTTNAGGITEFFDTSTAANATLIANGSAIWFLSDSVGGTARVEVFGFGTLYIHGHNTPGVAIGSIEGTGYVFLGANNLTVGSNNLSTTLSGPIQDYGNLAGSFTKIGMGMLTLTGVNTYAGGTTIEGGKLVVNNMSGSGTGTGAVQVKAGTLLGRGTIAGAVTVGTGSGGGAVLAPGRRGGKPGTPLTIQSTLTFNSDATYKCELKTKRVIADKVVANGVTINGAQFSFVSCGTSALTPGTVFTVIDNTAATPISGTFSNLADGSTFTVGGNTYQVSYEGGDGNDFTLTVQ